MKLRLDLILLLIIPSFISAQNISSFEAQDEMCTVMILEANDSCIFRIGVQGLGNDHIKKTSSDGKELASRKLNDTKNKVRLRGAYVRDNLIHVLIADDDSETTKLRLSIMDMDLNLVEEKLIYKGPLIGHGWKAKTFFEANNNGFIMIRDYLNNKRVWLTTFIYSFDKDSVYTSKLEFEATSKQEIIDIAFSENLEVSLITSYLYNLGSHKTRVLNKIDSYLIYTGMNKPLTYLKLNPDGDCSNRSFNSFYYEGKLHVASLDFDKSSNIFKGYFIRSYDFNSSNLDMENEKFIPFEDYSKRDEWGISKQEVSKRYEKDKNGKNTKNSHLANLHIGEVFVLENGNLLLLIREAEYEGRYFKDLQISNIDIKSGQIIWWNRLLNAPRNMKNTSFRYSIQNPLWSSLNIGSELISMTPILKSNQLVLLYGTFHSLYYKNELIQNKEVKQSKFMLGTSMTTKLLGRTKVDLQTGAFTNDLIFDEDYGVSSFFSFSYVNIEGLCENMEKVYIPLETPVKWKSIILTFPLMN